MLNLGFLLLFLISAASRSAQERPVTIRVGTLLRHGREEFILQLTCLLRPGARLVFALQRPLSLVHLFASSDIRYDSDPTIY